MAGPLPRAHQGDEGLPRPNGSGRRRRDHRLNVSCKFTAFSLLCADACPVCCVFSVRLRARTPGADEARLGSMPLQSRAAPVAECSQVDLGRHLPAIPAEVVDDVFVEEPRFPDGQQRIEIEIRPLALLLPGVEQRLSRFELAVIGADTRRVLAEWPLDGKSSGPAA